MQPVRRVEGPAIVFLEANVDTDAIIPARFLKTVGREGLGRGLFAALREADPANPFDRGRGAPILVVGPNFGCGSSREHAPWALADFGIRAIVGTSFADIFAGNAGKNGLVLARLEPDALEAVATAAAGGALLAVDVESRSVTVAGGKAFLFPLDDFTRHLLLEGLDEIALTERHEADIAAFEARLPAWVPGAAARP